MGMAGFLTRRELRTAAKRGRLFKRGKERQQRYDAENRLSASQEEEGEEQTDDEILSAGVYMVNEHGNG